MQQIIIAAAALAFLSVPAADAGTLPAAPGPTLVESAATMQPKEVRWVRRGVVAGPAWAVGRPYPLWPRMIVRDFVRYGLRAPAPGLVWVRAGNKFLLVRSGTGVVVAVR